MQFAINLTSKFFVHPRAKLYTSTRAHLIARVHAHTTRRFTRAKFPPLLAHAVSISKGLFIIGRLFILEPPDSFANWINSPFSLSLVQNKTKYDDDNNNQMFKLEITLVYLYPLAHIYFYSTSAL